MEDLNVNVRIVMCDHMYIRTISITYTLAASSQQLLAKLCVHVLVEDDVDALKEMDQTVNS